MKSCLQCGMTDIQARLSALKRHGIRSQIAKACNKTPSAITQWSKVPAEDVHTVERLTGIPRSELRPDLYPPEREA